MCIKWLRESNEKGLNRQQGVDIRITFNCHSGSNPEFFPFQQYQFSHKLTKIDNHTNFNNTSINLLIFQQNYIYFYQQQISGHYLCHCFWEMFFDGGQSLLYRINLIVIVLYAVSGWLIPLGIKINYGKLKSSISKLQFNPKLAWFLFEVPNLIWAAYFLLVVGDSLSLGYFLFIAHYINRDIIYPFFTLKTKNKVPLEIILSAMSFTFANGYIQGVGNQKQSQQKILIIQIIGLIIFMLGMYINIKSDRILQRYKENSKEGSKYVLINQFLFKYVSNPNYLGEIIQWFGYFCICQTFQSFLFCFSTLNILVAFAIPRNQWNIKNIQGYPSTRKGCIPFVI